MLFKDTPRAVETKKTENLRGLEMQYSIQSTHQLKTFCKFGSNADIKNCVVANNSFDEARKQTRAAGKH